MKKEIFPITIFETKVDIDKLGIPLDGETNPTWDSGVPTNGLSGHGGRADASLAWWCDGRGCFVSLPISLDDGRRGPCRGAG